MASRIARDGRRLHQRRRAAAEKNRRHGAAAGAPRGGGDFGREGAHEPLLVDAAMADMAVEIAIGALRQAERPMDIDPERLVLRGLRRHCVGSSASFKAGLRQFEKGAGTMREAAPARRQSVLFLARSFPRRCAHARRAGTSDHSRSPFAARRPYRACRRPALRILRVWPSGQATQSADTKRAVRCRATSRRAFSSAASTSPWRRRNSCRARPARRVNAGRAAERIDHEAGIIGRMPASRAHRPPRSALICAFRESSRRFPPARRGRPRRPKPPRPLRRQKLAHLGSLPGLWVAITRRPVIAAMRPMRHYGRTSPRASAGRSACRRPCGPAPASPAIALR